MKELDTGNTTQYEAFCKDYYDHAAVEGKGFARGCALTMRLIWIALGIGGAE